MLKSLLIACLWMCVMPVFAVEYVITAHGVNNDSTILNTVAIQSVIDKAAANGGGTIVIPKGVFLSGALFFKPGTKLRLAEGAVLKGSDNIHDYPCIPSRMEGKKMDYYAALINAYHVDGFSISGSGTINGNGYKFWKYFWAYRDSVKATGRNATNLEVHRPRLIFVWGCNNVTIANVKLYNSGFWTTHLYQSNQVLIENCEIRSPFKPVKAPSTDGVDIDVCNNVIVRGCFISVNDDAVCIKGGKGPNALALPENGEVKDILVENCTFGESHAALTIGSESILARNITMRNCQVNTSTPILKFKMRPDTYQKFEHVTVENITGKCGSIIDLKPWKQFFDMEGSDAHPYGIVHDVVMKNINVDCNSFGVIEGNANDSVYNFTFENITARAKESGLQTKYKGILSKNVIINGKLLKIE